MNLLEKLVVCEYTDGTVAFVGEVIAYTDQPSYDVKVGNEHKNWIARLTREATPEEAIAYWKERAIKAEESRRNYNTQRDLAAAQNSGNAYNGTWQGMIR